MWSSNRRRSDLRSSTSSIFSDTAKQFGLLQRRGQRGWNHHGWKRCWALWWWHSFLGSDLCWIWLSLGMHILKAFCDIGWSLLLPQRFFWKGDVVLSCPRVCERLNKLISFHCQQVMLNNTAVLDGGGLSLLGGSSLVIEDEGCSLSCDPSSAGNGVCDPACLTRGCNWYAMRHISFRDATGLN